MVARAEGQLAVPRMKRAQMNDDLARPKRNAEAVPSKLKTLVSLAMIGAEAKRDNGLSVTIRCTEIKRAGRRCKGKSERRSDKCRDHLPQEVGE